MALIIDGKAISAQIKDEFLEECLKACPNEEALCNIVLDVCYNSNSGKLFAWEMCGDVIINNLMNRYGHRISFPVANDEGEIEYAGSRYELITLDLEDDFG